VVCGIDEAEWALIGSLLFTPASEIAIGGAQVDPWEPAFQYVHIPCNAALLCKHFPVR
jgi:hypothetical protein